MQSAAKIIGIVFFITLFSIIGRMIFLDEFLISMFAALGAVLWELFFRWYATRNKWLLPARPSLKARQKGCIWGQLIQKHALQLPRRLVWQVAKLAPPQVQMRGRQSHLKKTSPDRCHWARGVDGRHPLPPPEFLWANHVQLSPVGYSLHEAHAQILLVRQTGRTPHTLVCRRHCLSHGGALQAQLQGVGSAKSVLSTSLLWHRSVRQCAWLASALERWRDTCWCALLIRLSHYWNHQCIWYRTKEISLWLYLKKFRFMFIYSSWVISFLTI